MMNHIGKTCPYCQFPLKADSNVTYCSACGIPHHRECWVENRGCTTFGCQERDYYSVIDERQEFSFEEIPVNRSAVLSRPSGVAAVFEAGQPENCQNICQLTYQTGELSLQELPIGARVFDPTWLWEFRTGNNYTGSGEQKPVVWIVVAKDHYKNLPSHVTLLSAELIGKSVFDMSKRSRGFFSSTNHWGYCGFSNDMNSLRLWLNSDGMQAGKGFYRAFSKSFKQALLTTTLPNREWKNGIPYSTKDSVFLPSTTELGDNAHYYTYRIGSVYPYFYGMGHAKRVASLGGKTWWYGTRSPDSSQCSLMRGVNSENGFGDNSACDDLLGVRPVLNLKADLLVTELR